MLRLIQTGNALPASFPVDPNAEFQPGMIAQLNICNSVVVCGLSDGTNPVGVIDDIKDSSTDTTKASGKITVWNAPATFQTDQFEKEDEYSLGDLLFVSTNALFTTKENGVAVGTVLVPPSAVCPVLEVNFWGNIHESRIFAEISKERFNQDAKWGGESHDDRHNSHDWIAIIVKHLGRAGYPWDPTRFRKQMIIVASLAMAAIEWVDRLKPYTRKTND